MARALLFVCSENALRSPMAEAMVKADYGDRIFVDSVGIRQGVLDAMAVAVMQEMGVDISGHVPKLFNEMNATSFDLIVTLTPEAQHRAIELTRTSACEVIYWRTLDPSVVEGNRDVRLDAYRGVRDALRRQIVTLLGTAKAEA
ncbi:MAG: arsenate reductase/protein-tyrosine-phosphatase family protein [Alphaproteobacteria bacterium]